MSDVPRRIEALGVVPVVELPSIGHAGPLLEALSAGGLPAAEITLRTEAGLEAIGSVRRSHPEALVGAGTVRTAADARRAIDAGAQFIVSPGTDREVIEVCRTHGIPAIPGACTPTEVQAAVGTGVNVIKFFPAEPAGGVAYLKALAGPFPEVRFVPTGGVTVENLRRYLELPTVVACGGTWLARRTLLADGRFDRVEALAAEAVAIVAEVRGR